MKAVLISIQAKWCNLIASGKKTVEVRKIKPKIDLPFKCYIYETQGRTETPFVDEEGHYIFEGRGKVIGEFVCDQIKEITADSLVAIYFNNPQESTCLNDLEMRKYADGKNLFLWHISNLVIYDKPKELSEFTRFCEGVDGTIGCRGCRYYSGKHEECLVGNSAPLKRPPQSWCYVEESREKI